MNLLLQENDVVRQQRFIIIPPILTKDVVHIWQFSFSQHKDRISYFWTLLNHDEKKRAETFLQNQHRYNFATARAILRYLLAQYLKCEPQDIVFKQNDHGKLALAQSDDKSDNNLSLQFNLSHAKDVVIYAFAIDRHVGIDVEYIRDDVSLAEIARRFFALEEQKTLFALPPDQQSDAFFACWTRKEAFIKAIGKGLSYSLKKFIVDLSVQQKTAKVNLKINDNKLHPTLWSLFNLSTIPQYCAAVAIEGACEIKQIHMKSTVPQS